MEEEYKSSIKEGVKSAFPVVIGYIPVAIAFGILAKNTGISLKETSFFSLFIYAGASQFMALELIQAGIGPGSIILATFLLNLRHMMMSASLSTKLHNIKRSYLPLVAFGITDETFSILSFTKNKLDLPFVLIVNFLSYFSWVGGSILGYLVGEVLPQSVQTSLGIGLYGLFAALLFPQLKGEKNNFFLALLAVVIYVILFYSNIFSSGWDIILAIILSSGLGVLIFKKDEKGDVRR